MRRSAYITNKGMRAYSTLQSKLVGIMFFFISLVSSSMLDFFSLIISDSKSLIPEVVGREKEDYKLSMYMDIQSLDLL